MREKSTQKSKVRGVLGLIGAGFGAIRAVNDLRTARGKKDGLALANAVANILVVLTGAALVVRDLRGGGTAVEGGESK